MLGAFFFGFVIGWYVYFINRYRKADVKIQDLASVISIVGGGAVLALFPAGSELFSAYGIGLAVGFLSYFFILILFVILSKNFTVDWFLDGRRVKPRDDEIIPEDTAITIQAMGVRDRAEGVRDRAGDRGRFGDGG